jgi:hypothetical protein
MTMIFDLLPSEIIKYIFAKIDIKERAKCRLISVHCRNLIDDKLMWSDVIPCLKMKFSRHETCNWVYKNTDILDKSNIRLFSLIESIDYAINPGWILENYIPDRCYAETLIIQSIKHRSPSNIKKISKHILKLYPDIRGSISVHVFNTIYNMKHTSDRKFGWIIEKFINKDIKISRNLLGNLIIKFAKHGCCKSAKLLIEIYEHKDMNVHNILDFVDKYFGYKGRDKLCSLMSFVRIFKLNTLGAEYVFTNLIRANNPSSLSEFWEATNIIPANKLLWNDDLYILRSAKIAYAMIYVVSDFRQLEWIINRFDYVLKLIKHNDPRVVSYIKAIEEKDMGCSYSSYYKPLSGGELISRMPFYIKAGNLRKFKEMFEYIRYKNIDIHIKEWLIIANEYSPDIYDVLINRV